MGGFSTPKRRYIDATRQERVDGKRRYRPKKYSYVGKVVGNVSIRSVIAEGGMGVIYLGEQALTHRKVAVKILRPERQKSHRDREYFLREAKALSQIRHPYLLELYNFGKTRSGEYYMVLEYVPGRTLRQLVDQEGVLPPLRCIHLFRQLLLALQATHAHGILHRDLKPDNLLIEELNNKERLRLADLGLVKFTKGNMRPLTEVGMTVGTPCYMAPEQVRGKRLDARSDLYSTGVLMFEALTSYLPYPKAPNVDKLLDHILDSKPAKLVRADVKFKRYPGLQKLLDRLLAKKPIHRPTSSAEVISIMDELLETELAEELQKALMGSKEQDPALMSRRFLSKQVAQEVRKLPNNQRADRESDSVTDGVIISFKTRNRKTGDKLSPSPQLLQGLRAWLEEGGTIVAAERQGNTVTYGLSCTSESERMLAGLPYLIYRVKKKYPELSLSAGMSAGPFKTDKHGRPCRNKTVVQAQRFAQRAVDGQILVGRHAANQYNLGKKK